MPESSRRSPDTPTQRLVAAVKQEIRQDLNAYNAYVAEHGSPVEIAREHFSDYDDAL